MSVVGENDSSTRRSAPTSLADAISGSCTVKTAPRPKISVGQSLQRWLASLIEYFELRIRLLGLESKEAGLHVLSLALLLVSTLTLFAGFLAMLVIFFLFLLTLLFGWP